MIRSKVLPSPIGRGAGGEGGENPPVASGQWPDNCLSTPIPNPQSQIPSRPALTLTLSQGERGLDEAISHGERGLDEMLSHGERGLDEMLSHGERGLDERLPLQIEPILAHELAHVRRGDAFACVLQTAAQVLWWFHPLVWWANRDMSRRREQCCDEEVLTGVGCSPAAYARCLVDVLEWECRRGRRRLLSAVPGVRSAEMTTTRLEHIMDDAKRFHGRTPRWIWGVLALAMLLFLPGRAMVSGQSDESNGSKSLLVLCRFTNQHGKMTRAQKMMIEPDGPAGQIVDVAQSPFVTTFYEITDPKTHKKTTQPHIVVLEEGTRIRVNLNGKRPTGIALDADIEQSEIVDVDTKGGADWKVQIPKIETKKKRFFDFVKFGELVVIPFGEKKPDGFQPRVEMRVIASGKATNPGAGVVSVPAVNHAARRLAFSPDSRTLAGGMHDGNLIVWDATGGKETNSAATDSSSVRAILYLPDGENVLTAGKSVQRWNAKTGRFTSSVELENGENEWFGAKAFSHDGARLAGAASKTFWIWDTKTGRKTWTVSLMGIGLSAAFSPDGRRVAVGTSVPWGDTQCKSGVQIWDVQTGQLKRTILEPTGSIGGLAFSNNGKLLAGGTHREVIVWDAETGAVQKHLPGFHGPVEAIAFSPDDRLLAAGGQGPESRTTQMVSVLSELNVWNPATGEKVLTQFGSLLRFTSVVFSRDGKRIAACDNRTVIVLDIQEKKPIWSKEYETEIRPDIPRDATSKSLFGAPTPVEIAKVNDATWNAIRSVDVEYTLASQCVENGKLTRDTQSKGRWSKADGRERLREYPEIVKINTSRFGSPASPEFKDYYFNGRTVQVVQDSRHQESSGEICGGLLTCIGTREKWWPDTSEAEALRYLWGAKDKLTLSQIIAAWKISRRGARTTDNGDTLWLLHAEYPAKDVKDIYAGSYIDIEVNANKGGLVQKVFHYTNGIAHLKDGTPVASCSVYEVKEFWDCGHGVFYPKRMECHLIEDPKKPESKDGVFRTIAATKLSVNATMPADAFDFRFPNDAFVYEDTPDGRSGKCFIWGPDNKPAKEFATREEYDKYARGMELEEWRKQVEKKIASKKPVDLVQRGQYYVVTKKYDEAVAAFSEAIAVAPKMKHKLILEALGGRGTAYLLKQDSRKAIADFTETIRLAKEQNENDGMTSLYFVRGLAYAWQDDTLDEAVADLTKGLSATKEDGIDLAPEDTKEMYSRGYLLRAAIRARQGKTADEIAHDASEAFRTYPDSDACAFMAYLMEKSGDRAGAAKLRETAKQLAINPPEHDGDALNVAFDAAVHKCLVRLAPEIEKKP
jgi:WD40 repeat protein/tetratricopeptide (TPR) repeat protein